MGLMNDHNIPRKEPRYRATISRLIICAINGLCCRRLEKLLGWLSLDGCKKLNKENNSVLSNTKT